jgi:acetyl-CoA carboxylase biotin carboxylase subunit
MFRKVLIANRGEIAVRIIAALREMGIRSVAVYSEADRECLHARLADEALCIGPAAAAQSYLNIQALIAAAEVTQAEAVHPGYGFLAENPKFAEVCHDCGLVFIGPDASMMEKLGDKISARKLARKAGIPILGGTLDPVADPKSAVALALKLRFPVILKAAAGGGGRGMRVVTDARDFEQTFLSASGEAEKAFGDGRIYLEKYLENPRHVEIQVMADKSGEVLYFPERECSIQRRHQKLLEESPSPAVHPFLRKKMGECAVKLMKEARYEGAATVEFLLDEDGQFYFMEVNTRIQVEHPVTEEVTGADLIMAQVAVAAGERIGALRKHLQPVGHAIEFRINAEDPKTFVPSPGKVTALAWPSGPGVRVDSHLYAGYSVPPYYDSLLAKLIVRGSDRAETIRRARRALSCAVIEGVKTSIPLFLRILDNAAFHQGDLSTRFLERQAIV